MESIALPGSYSKQSSTGEHFFSRGWHEGKGWYWSSFSPVRFIKVYQGVHFSRAFLRKNCSFFPELVTNANVSSTSNAATTRCWFFTSLCLALLAKMIQFDSYYWNGWLFTTSIAMFPPKWRGNEHLGGGSSTCQFDMLSQVVLSCSAMIFVYNMFVFLRENRQWFLRLTWIRPS